MKRYFIWKYVAGVQLTALMLMGLLLNSVLLPSFAVMPAGGKFSAFLNNAQAWALLDQKSRIDGQLGLTKKLIGQYIEKKNNVQEKTSFEAYYDKQNGQLLKIYESRLSGNGSNTLTHYYFLDDHLFLVEKSAKLKPVPNPKALQRSVFPQDIQTIVFLNSSQKPFAVEKKIDKANVELPASELTAILEKADDTLRHAQALLPQASLGLEKNTSFADPQATAQDSPPANNQPAPFSFLSTPAAVNDPQKPGEYFQSQSKLSTNDPDNNDPLAESISDSSASASNDEGQGGYYREHLFPGIKMTIEQAKISMENLDQPHVVKITVSTLQGDVLTRQQEPVQGALYQSWLYDLDNNQKPELVLASRSPQQSPLAWVKLLEWQGTVFNTALQTSPNSLAPFLPSPPPVSIEETIEIEKGRIVRYYQLPGKTLQRLEYVYQGGTLRQITP